MWCSDLCNMWTLLVTILLTIILWYLNQSFSFWSKRGVPFIKPHWLFGNFKNFVKGKTSLTEVTIELYNELKGLKFGGVWQMQRPTLFVRDPFLLREIMVKDFDVWSSRGIPYNPKVDPLAAHLINLEGEKWKSVRAKLTPTFTSAKLKQMYHLLAECANGLEEELHSVSESGEFIEAKEMAAKFTTDVIGSCIFGIQMNSHSEEETLFRKMGKKIFRLTFRKKSIRLLQTNFPRLFKFLRLASIDEELTKFFLGIVKESFRFRENNNVVRHDFIDLLRQLKSTDASSGDDDIVFDDTLLTAQAFVFFGAGFETSSGAISYCLHELAVNENVQDRLRKEVRETRMKNGGEITWDALKNMKYLEMVLQETLRKHPPITVSTRTSVKPYTIPGTKVDLPTGTQCLIPIYALHHDPQFYPEPEKFDPQRFADEVNLPKSAPHFIPFGDGPRSCIGSRFAEQQTKLGIVTVVENFRVSLCEKSENPLQHSLQARFLAPKMESGCA